MGSIYRPMFVMGEDQRLAIKKNRIDCLQKSIVSSEDGELERVYDWINLYRDGLIKLVVSEEEYTVVMTPRDLGLPAAEAYYLTTFTHTP
eukprot:gene46894-58491_t